MPLQWTESTVEWNLVDHEMWRGLDGDRPVAQVATEWAEGRWVWAGYYWGDLPPTSLGVALGRDPRRVNGVFESAEAAMAAVDERHDRTLN